MVGIIALRRCVCHPVCSPPPQRSPLPFPEPHRPWRASPILLPSSLPLLALPWCPLAASCAHILGAAAVVFISPVNSPQSLQLLYQLLVQVLKLVDLLFKGANKILLYAVEALAHVHTLT